MEPFMTDEDLRRWWPEFGALLAGLGQAGGAAAADRLVEAARAGATSSEILGLIGVVLREHRALRSRMDDSGKIAWDAVMADVNRPYPLRRLAEWFDRLAGR
jgi:hypothetical protein